MMMMKMTSKDKRSFSSILVLVFLVWLSPTVCNPSSEVTWHLPLLGLPVNRSSQNPSPLRFIRHPDPRVRLSGKLPSLAITVTRNNLLGVLNPKNGEIIWRIVLPKAEPIIDYTVDLNNRNLALISGGKTVTVRLLTLEDGRLLWSRSLVDADSAQERDDLPGNGYDLLFAVEQHSEHRSLPDLLVGRRSQLFRLTGNDGGISWKWTTPDPTWKILKILEQNSLHDINILLAKADSGNAFTTQVQALSSTTGVAHDHRAQSKQRCQKTEHLPLIIMATSDTSQHSANQAIICVDPEGHISSALVPEVSKVPSKVLTFSDLARKHPILDDLGLAQKSTFLAKLSDGAALVFSVNSDGSLKLLWSFDPTDLITPYTGSIDRNGLPYVSKVNYVPSLGLASLEILSLTPTEYAPDGIIVGNTFRYDFLENGNIIAISVEVLQVKNYTPMARVMLVTDGGDIQLWQGESFQWTRHEDLSLSTSITLHQPKSFGGPLLSKNLTEIPRYLAKVFSGLMSLKLPSADQTYQPLANEYIWLVGSETGRLFAITRNSQSEGNILWKRNLMPPGVVGSKATVKWADLVVKGASDPQHSQIIVSIREVSISKDGTETQFVLGLMDGKILEKKTSKTQDEASSSSVPKRNILLSAHDRDMGASPARFLGDRGALFKYLNPNLAVYLNNDLSRQTIQVVDQTSGALIWAFEFATEVDPASIHAVLTENWLVLASREKQNGSTRIHSIEWFMSSKADVRVDGSVANITSCMRAYLTAYDIKAIGLTKSRLGVTSRALLVVNDMDQIVSIPRRLLDVRRPYKKPTAQEIEEMLIMYDPMIMTDPKMVITGDRPVKDLQGVYSFSTEFESTSAVIGVGLDLFASSIAPSRTFDMLGYDFNKAQLVLTSAGLLLSALILGPIVKNKQLRRQWYT